MNVLDKVQVFKEIVLIRKKWPPFIDFVVQKWVISHFLHFWGVFSNGYEKLASLKQNLTYRKGKSDIVIHQYA